MKYIDIDKLIANLERQNVDKKVIQPLIRIIDSLSEEPELVRHPPIAYTYPSDASRDEQLKMALLALLNSDLIKVAGNKFTKQDLIDWVKKQEHQEVPDKSLEEAAEEYYDEMWDELGGFAETRGGCYDIFFPSKAIRDTFIAGAEWQKQQDLAEMAQSKNPLSVAYANRCFENGKKAMREQMLKDAEECELYWDGDFLAIDLNMAALGYSERDKVKVIVLKAEED